MPRKERLRRMMLCSSVRTLVSGNVYIDETLGQPACGGEPTEQMVNGSSKECLIPTVPYVKLHLNKRCAKYISEDVISGRVTLNIPRDSRAFFKGCFSKLNLVIQLKCELKLDLGNNDRVKLIEYEMRFKAACIEVPPKLSEECSIPFQIILTDVTDVCPPTLRLRGLGYGDSGFEWTVAAWVEGEVDNNFELNHYIRDQQIIEIYPRSPYQRVKKELVDKEFTIQDGSTGCSIKLLELPSHLPQSPERFNINLLVTPSSSLFIHGFDIELEMELTLFTGKRTIVHRKLEKIGSIVYENLVNREIVLVATDCIIPTRRPQNISTPNVTLVHSVLVTFRGHSKALLRIPIDVLLPKPLVMDTIGESRGLWPSLMGWIDSVLSPASTPALLY